MKNKLLIILLLLNFNLFSQEVYFKSDYLIDDKDTLSLDNKNWIFIINLTDKIFIETLFDNGLLEYSNKKRIIEESVHNGVVTFKTIDGEVYKLKIFPEYAELSIGSDFYLKWIGTYNINFNIMLKR